MVITVIFVLLLGKFGKVLRYDNDNMVTGGSTAGMPFSADRIYHASKPTVPLVLSWSTVAYAASSVGHN